MEKKEEGVGREGEREVEGEQERSKKMYKRRALDRKENSKSGR